MEHKFIPHPFPYQGSKRNIALKILPYIPKDTPCLIEPFCGTGAISIACAVYGISNKFILNDLNKPLITLWGEILNNPQELLDKYQLLWNEQQHQNSKEFFLKIRDQFNQEQQPHHFLYLLARIVKGSIRYNSHGQFNQSSDNRRLGMKPSLMSKNIFAISNIMKNRTSLFSLDFSEIINQSDDSDIIYLDPPYQGTSDKRNNRYLKGLSFDEFVDILYKMEQKNKMFIVSYDGKTGNKIQGKILPNNLKLKHLYINSGRSSQSSLLGRKDITLESLYLSRALLEKLNSLQQI